jgi:hypothetical protein
MTARPGSGDAPSRLLRVLFGSSAVVVLVLAGGWFLFDTEMGASLLGQDKAVVTYGISLVPDTTGTQVEVIGESSGSIPSRVDVDLRTVDDVTLTNGGPTTGARLHYSNMEDGLGNVIPAEQVRSGRLREVNTDGRRLQLSFHVDMLAGNRIIYPVPMSPQLDWVAAHLYPQGTMTCWADGASGDSAFAPCGQSETIDGKQHASLRLALAVPPS